MCVEAHVLICHPDQGKTADQVPAPILEEQFVACDREKEDGHVMAEAVFAREDEKELAPKRIAVVPALLNAVVARLAKHFFVRYRPGDASNRNRQQEQPGNLEPQGHLSKDGFSTAQVAFIACYHAKVQLCAEVVLQCCGADLRT